MVTVPESVTRSGVRKAFGALETESAGLRSSQTRPKKRHLAIWLFAGWIVLSFAWTGFLLMDLYDRAAAQADMSREVERDLDSASCGSGPCEAVLDETPQENWSNVAETYLQFGYVSLLEWTILPPAALLAAGIGGIVMLRRRKTTLRA